MKKSLCVAAIAALFCASATMAATLEVRVVEQSSQSSLYNVSGDPETVTVEIQARLDGGGASTSDGLAIIGLNLKATGSGGEADPDLCDTGGFLVVAPTSMQSFDRKDTTGPGFTNDGLTNPSGSPNVSGYSGTCDGALGLLQIGGGQNTIGNTSGGAPYPVGTVVGQIANGGWQVVAVGDLDTSLSGTEEILLAVDTVFANTLDDDATGPPFAVTEVLSGDITTADLTIAAGVLCANTDVNCNGSTGGEDIGIVASGANFLQNPPPCDRADVDGLNGATGADIGIIASGANFLQNPTGPCVCVTATPGVAGCPTP